MIAKVKQESAVPAKAAPASATAPKSAAKTAPVAKAAPRAAAKKVVAPAIAPQDPPKPEKAEKVQKPKASKVIRDSFTFPESDYEKISELKKACLGLGINAKKSEILRAGLHALSALDKNKLKEVVSRVEKIKTGRPLG